MEKIKTIGSTYMAAAGLQPGQEEDRAKHEHNVITLVEFATALMAALDAINRESFQNFKLRTGQPTGRRRRGCLAWPGLGWIGLGWTGLGWAGHGGLHWDGCGGQIVALMLFVGGVGVCHNTGMRADHGRPPEGALSVWSLWSGIDQGAVIVGD